MHKVSSKSLRCKSLTYKSFSCESLIGKSLICESLTHKFLIHKSLTCKSLIWVPEMQVPNIQAADVNLWYGSPDMRVPNPDMWIFDMQVPEPEICKYLKSESLTNESPTLMLKSVAETSRWFPSFWDASSQMRVWDANPWVVSLWHASPWHVYPRHTKLQLQLWPNTMKDYHNHILF